MNLEKLRKLRTLANFLDDLPHDRFHMPSWASPDATEESCGTAGCAAGWAATIFRKEGWSFDHGFPRLEGCLGGAISGFMSFFGVSDNDALWITCDLTGEYSLSGRFTYCREYKLSSSKDITPRHAADRIRKVIKRLAPELLTEEPQSIARTPLPMGVGG